MRRCFRTYLTLFIIAALVLILAGCGLRGGALKLEKGVDWTTYQVQKLFNGPVDYLLDTPK